MRVSFSSMTAARAAVTVLEAYGYSAKQFGRDVVTTCPTLLALPAIQKRVGLGEIEHLDLTGAELSSEPDSRGATRGDDLAVSHRIAKAGASREMTA
jgi:hypothetical protein